MFQNNNHQIATLNFIIEFSVFEKQNKKAKNKLVKPLKAHLKQQNTHKNAMSFLFDLSSPFYLILLELAS